MCNQNLNFQNMTKEDLLKQISYLQTKINLQKAIETPVNTIIGYALMAMSSLNFTEQDILKVERTIYSLLKEKSQDEVEDFYIAHHKKVYN